METWYHCPVCCQTQSVRFPCHHVSLERRIARLAHRMIAGQGPLPGATRIWWDVRTARFIATLEVLGHAQRTVAWAEDEVKPAGPAGDQVVRARLDALFHGRGPARKTGGPGLQAG